MKREEIKEFLSETKAYVNGKSAEIQKKLFSLGFRWNSGDRHKIDYTDKPFLYIGDELNLSYGEDMLNFTSHRYREITAEEILSLEITEPSYRPFKSQEECFEEMQTHIPFGWLKSKQNGCFLCIGKVLFSQEYKNVLIAFSTNESLLRPCATIFEEYTFMDGTPFGIKEE